MINVCRHASDSAKNLARLFRLPIALFLVSLAAISAFGQGSTITGAMQGNVKNDQTGDPVVGAVIVITNVETGFVYNKITDSKGVFFQDGLASGIYNISITAPTLKPKLIQIPIKIMKTGDVVPVPIQLEPETGPPTTVTVPDPPIDIRLTINTTDARRSESLSKDEIVAIPLGASGISRSFDEIALLAPGVAPPPQTIGDVAGPGVGPGVGSAGQFAVNGLRSRANNFTVDGSDNNDEDIGVRRQGFVAFVPQPIESIEEFSIVTLLAPAQFGRNIGAQVNAVSKAGANKFKGSVYGHFNSDKLNARNRFDSANGDAAAPLRTAGGQSVLLDGTPITVRNQSGGEDSFTFAQAGANVGGSIVPNKLFYFFSGEYQRINASREKSFAVPTVEQRGPFRTGATGISTNFFTGAAFQTPLVPTGGKSNAVFSLFPFANDPAGVYGENTFTQSLAAGGRGVILSGRLDNQFKIGEQQHTITGRYNFTDDDKSIPAVNEAIFSNIKSQIQTHNLSLFLSSDLSGASSSGRLFNQLRFSVGHTRLKFQEIRNTQFLRPSSELPNEPFFLNAPVIFNATLPQFNGQARYTRIDPEFGFSGTTEDYIGPLGQVVISGFSPLGVDVYNFPQDRTNRTYQFADDLTFRTGDHAFVFGTDIRRTNLNSDLPRLARTLLTFNGSPRLVQRTGTCANGGVGNFCFLPQSDPRSIIRPEDLAAFGAASNALLNLNVDRPDSRLDLLYNQYNFFAQDTWRPRAGLSLSLGLRYEYNTPVREADNLIEETFSDARAEFLPALVSLINDRESLYRPDRNNFAPRIGLAYSANIFGSNRVTVLRAGYGLFYDQILGAVANQSRNLFPTHLTVNYAGTVTDPDFPIRLSINNPATATINSVPLRRPGTVNLYNSAGFALANRTIGDVLRLQARLYANAVNVTLPSEKMEMPMAHHYSVVVEQQLNRNFSLTAGYVGTSGRNLLRFTTPNLGSSLTTVPTSMRQSFAGAVPQVLGLLFVPVRPLDLGAPVGSSESLGAVNQFETTSPSTYHSLQTQLRGRFLNSLNAQFSYTFSKATDEVSDVFDLAGAYVLPQNSFDLKAERGPANFDVRHRFAYDLVYSFGGENENAFIRHLTKNLQIATTGRYHSGQPFTVNSVIDVNLDGNTTDRLNTLQGLEITGDRSQPLRLTTNNTNTLLAPFGQSGLIGRNIFRAGSVLELDVSVIKKVGFGGQSISFRTDIFNIINRTNYAIPVRLLEAPAFGKAVNTITPGRRVQFSLKYQF